jgi:hypothetical protein
MPHRVKAITAEEIEQIGSIAGIRKRILEARRFDPIVNQVFKAAEMAGLSGEETFVMLAYHALVSHEDVAAAYRDHLNSCARPSAVIWTPSAPPAKP